ncbi:MAG: hypothetical protein DA408_20440 [Bacteroidetes bacterium]|nr:MAG: hypothetical protein DA408_20440 [Bacteroidota bacterium]
MEGLASRLTESITINSQRTALRSAEGTWTYQQLGMYGAEARTFLQAQGLVNKGLLGICLPKSTAYVGIITSALHLNIPYVPLDIESPVSRLAYIMEDAGLGIVFTTKAQATLLKAHLPDLEITPFTPDDTLVLLTRELAGEDQKPLPPDLAYILYTSGSTGHPKGVSITHENAWCFINWASTFFPVAPGETVASIAPFHFDLSVFDLFVTLVNGGQLVLFTQRECRNPLLVAQQLSEHQVGTLYATPSLLQLLLRYGRLSRYDFSALRRVLFAGEVFPIEPLRQLQACWIQADFYNLYGPTETNVVTWFPVPKPIAEGQTAPYPIGQLCPYAQGAIWCENAIANWEPDAEGELLICGDSLTPGYWGQVEKNKSAFLSLSNQKWYKTGDRVRINHEGDLVYLGRTDRMVKRRGYRIELAEIEQAFTQHQAIVQAAAVSRIQPETGAEITVFYQLGIPSTTLTTLALKQFCNAQLPTYMIPDHFVVLDTFPYTSSQKVDYQVLQAKMEDHV